MIPIDKKIIDNIKMLGINMIKNANSGAVCIECIGNFDKENMPAAQKDAIVQVVKAFLKKPSAVDTKGQV